jgi:hypothetical protein
VVKEPGSACDDKAQCSELGTSFECEENKCISKDSVKKEGDSQEESGK